MGSADVGASAQAHGVSVHEVGHVLGLANVDDDNETMDKSARRDGRLGPGDRIGLGQVGAGPCYG